MYFFALFVSVLQICSIYSDRTSDTSKTFLCQCNKNSSPESFYIALLASTFCFIKTKLKIVKNLNCAPVLLLISFRF